MRKSLTAPRIVLALLGALTLLLSIALGAATTRPTEASWQDTAHGRATFAAAQNAGQNHARSMAGFGIIQRQISSANIGPGIAQADSRTQFAINPVAHESSGAFWALPLRLSGSACAATSEDRADSCGAPALPSGSSYATSETSQIGLWAAGFEGIENLSYGSDSGLKATATCSPGQTGRTSITAGGPIVIRGNANLYLPTRNHQTVAKRDVGARSSVRGVLQNHQSSGPGWAKAELRFYAQSDITASDWTLHVVLASAECRLSSASPAELTRPTTAAPANLPESPNSPPGVTSRGLAAAQRAIVAEQPTAAPFEERDVDHAERDGDVERPSVSPTAIAPPGTAASTTPSAAPATTATTATTAERAGTEPATTVPLTSAAANPEGTTTPAPAGQPAEASVPQEPENVRIGREFAIVNRDGVELGAAKVEDIVRTPGCGVEFTLSITTSAEAGPDRWASIEPSDFAEVRPGGSIRKAKRMTSDCEQSATSRTTALSPGREYEIVIAFALDDSAQQGMLRPDGTAGWVFDLPPLPRVSTTKPTPTTGPQAVAPTSSPSATTSAVSEETAAATAEA